MQAILKTFLILTAAALTACTSGLGHGPLDGRVFDIELLGGPAPQADQLVFDGGRFESTICRPHGFLGANYTARADGGATAFEASVRSPKAGTNAWSGTIKDGTIEGTLARTDVDGKTSEMRFRGRPARGLLDGRRFEGQVCEGDATTGDKDTLLFTDGGFDSHACRTYGFTIAPYVATPDGDGVRFTTAALNGDGDTNEWQGVVRGEQVTGTMQHKNAAGKVVYSYRFEATLLK